MKIKKEANTLSASQQTNMIMSSVALLFILFSLAVYLYSNKVLGAVMLGTTLLFSIKVVNQMFTKIKLYTDRIEIDTPFEKRVFQKKSIQKSSWESGGGVYLLLTDNRKITIPDLGNAQSVCNAVRAWLKRSQ